MWATHEVNCSFGVNTASATMDNPAVIDLGVVMHKTWLGAMKEPLTKDTSGKYYENGAQFAIARIKAQSS